MPQRIRQPRAGRDAGWRGSARFAADSIAPTAVMCGVCRSGDDGCRHKHSTRSCRARSGDITQGVGDSLRWNGRRDRIRYLAPCAMSVERQFRMTDTSV